MGDLSGNLETGKYDYTQMVTETCAFDTAARPVTLTPKKTWLYLLVSSGTFSIKPEDNLQHLLDREETPWSFRII